MYTWRSSADYDPAKSSHKELLIWNLALKRADNVIDDISRSADDSISYNLFIKNVMGSDTVPVDRKTAIQVIQYLCDTGNVYFGYDDDTCVFKPVGHVSLNKGKTRVALA